MKKQKLEDLRIMTVDDDAFMLVMITAALNQLGISQVVTHTSATEALDFLEDDDQPFDLILTDLHMPNVDGIEFISKLSARGYKDSIALLSGADENLVKMAEKLASTYGIDIRGILKKPATVDNLREIVSPLLEQPGEQA